MKKLLFAFLMTMALCALGDKSDVASRFELCCPLADPPAKGVRGRLRIPGDVFDQSRNFPADLRILDENGTQWPFFIAKPSDRTFSEKQTPQILNKAFVDGPEPHWEFDLVMPEDKPGAVHNRLEISTSGNDFVRRVEISRSKEGGLSAHLGSGYLISFPNNRNARNNRITYPDTDVARLHVNVFTSAKNADEHFEVQRVAVYCQDKISAEREPVDATQCAVPENETDKRTQTFILDSGFQKRPVEFITFEVTDASFARCVSVSGRNVENEQWRNAGGGEVHRFEKGEKTTISVRAPYRWVKISVRQDDNLPLDIRSIRMEAIPRYLAFEAVSELPARLCFRGWDLPAPRYDLRTRTSEATSLTWPVVELEAMQPNVSAGSVCFYRKYSSLIGAVIIGGVSLLVIWIIISMMRRQPSP